MEWSKSSISGAELDRRRREYIDAAMNMSRRAAAGAPLPEEPAAAEVPEESEIKKTEAPPEPEEPREPEELHEPEEIPEDKHEKKTFGVFDMDELAEAVRNGEMDEDKLKEAAEILEEMSGKTKEMEKLAGRQESGKSGGQPQSLNRYIEQHNKGSCPRREGQHGANGS